MRVLHIVFSCFYIEGLGYQENLMPLYHKRQGHDVYVLTSTFKNSHLGTEEFKGLPSYVNHDGINVKILKRRPVNVFGKKYDFNEYYDVYPSIQEIEPDIIFLHGLLSISHLQVVKYVRDNPKVKVYADQHGDYYNSPIRTISQRFLNTFLWRPIIRKMDSVVSIYWGTTPWRCEYMEDIYKISKDKIRLLVMGADNERISQLRADGTREKTRESLNIKDEFVLITGGKIDKAKNLHLLMRAFNDLNLENTKLIIFGNLKDDIKAEFEELKRNPNIIYIGWIAADDVYKYMLASDLAVFPGTHSVLWEQACGCVLPAVYKKWPGMTHVDRDGNCEFLCEDSVEEIKSILYEIVSNKEKYKSMKGAAENNCVSYFSYDQIAKRAIEMEE